MILKLSDKQQLLYLAAITLAIFIYIYGLSLFLQLGRVGLALMFIAPIGHHFFPFPDVKSDEEEDSPYPYKESNFWKYMFVAGVVAVIISTLVFFIADSLGMVT